MYPRSPYAGASYPVTGSLMGQTLGFLAIFLLIAAISSVFSLQIGTMSLWLGMVALFGGTLAVNRSARRGGNALGWGVVVSIGMGLVAGPAIWAAALAQPQVVASALLTLILAVGLCAIMVAWIPWDFTRLAPLLMIGLFMLIAAGLLSWIIPGFTGLAMSPLFNLVGVAIFVGYLLVDFSLVRYRGIATSGNGMAVLLATAMMVDIVNLVLFLLALGRRR